MAYITEVTYTQSGNVNRAFTITFPFISSDDIKVQLDGISKTPLTDFTISGLTVTFEPGVLTTGTNVIRIFRDTDISDPLLVFQTGASIRAQDLNDLTEQLLFAIQEFNTLTGSGSGIALTLGDKNHITVNSGSDWTINTNVISNAMMLDNSIGSTELINLSVLTGKIADDAVTYGKMQHIGADHRLLGRDDSQTGQSNGSVAEVMIATNHIENDAVTYPKMQDIVTGNRVLGRATAGEIQEVQVTSNMIDPGTITYLQNPIGTVIWFAGTSAPTGYLKANGNTIPNGSGTVQSITADFSALYAVIGATLPDLRGEFVRGLDDGRGVDSGRSVRSAQTENLKQHDHKVANPTDLWGNTGTDPFVYEGATLMARASVESDNMEYALGGLDPSQYQPTLGRVGYYPETAGTPDDTRPRNVALLACIKY